MIRASVFLFLAFVVVWDLINSGPENAAVTRASLTAYRWARAEIERRDLVERAREVLADVMRAAQEAAASRAAVPSVAATPVEPIFVTPLAEAVLPAAPTAETRTAALARPSPDQAAPAGEPSDELVIGDSVFARDSILAFIAEASERTGVSAAYLEALALRESNFNPVAASDRSSARGLYQFIESTWLETFARHGGEHDQDELARLIAISADGQPSVSDARTRARILDLRYDPKLSTFLAARLARDNRTTLSAAMGRGIGDAELYIAHFLGVSGAEALLEAYADAPNATAADLFPWAARANRSFFYDGRREKTVAELYDALLLDAGELGGDGEAIAAS